MKTDDLLDRAIALLNQAESQTKLTFANREGVPISHQRFRAVRTQGAISLGSNGLDQEQCGSVPCAGTGQRVDKIGISTETQLNDRLAILGQDRYGSIQRGPDGRMIEHPGFDRWVAQAVHITRAPRHPAITVNARTIDISLPGDMTRRRLDVGLRKILAPYAADKYGIERFTGYGGVDRVSRQPSFFRSRPATRSRSLLEIVEAILDDHDAGASSSRLDLLPFDSNARSPKPKPRPWWPNWNRGAVIASCKN